MPSQIIDQNAPSLQEGMSAQPDRLPHGIIVPPQRVLDIVVKEKSKFGLQCCADETWRDMTDSLTLQYFFEASGHEVLYRRTPEGPEVLAVGFEEIQRYVKDMPIEDQHKLPIWTP